MSPEMAALAVLDEQLLQVLAQGDVRLVRSLWLLKQTDDFHIRRRQELEAQDGGEDWRRHVSVSLLARLYSASVAARVSAEGIDSCAVALS